MLSSDDGKPPVSTGAGPGGEGFFVKDRKAMNFRGLASRRPALMI
jgi:hypothetical protein